MIVKEASILHLVSDFWPSPMAHGYFCVRPADPLIESIIKFNPRLYTKSTSKLSGNSHKWTFKGSPNRKCFQQKETVLLEWAVESTAILLEIYFLGKLILIIFPLHQRPYFPFGGTVHYCWLSLQNRVIICKEPTHLTLSTATTTTTTADTRLPPLYNLQFFTALCVLSRRWKLKIIIIIISIPTARVTFQLCGRKRTSSRFLICFLRPLPACLLNRSSSKLLLVQSK